MDRRRFLGLGLVGGAASIAGLGLPPAAPAAAQLIPGLPGLGGSLPAGLKNSVNLATLFLKRAMDAYQVGSTTRIIQSYADDLLQGSTAFTYDNALAICALLLARDRDSQNRAALLGDSFIYAQNNDPDYSDDRLRQAYWVGPFSIPGASNDYYFVRPDGEVNTVGAPWFFIGSAVGDMAWASIALARLYARTRVRRYLDAAVRLGNWIVDNAYDTVGLGGYTFGVDNNNNRITTTKSCEHNIDVYALFTNLLAPLTGNRNWVTLGQHALDFIIKMWEPNAQFFYVGSNDGTTINPSPIALDVQSWSYLALLNSRYANVLDWAKTNLATTDTPQSISSNLTGNLRLSGVTFSSLSRHATQPAGEFDPIPDPDAVWFEGTGQMIAALFQRNRRATQDLPSFDGDFATASEYIRQSMLAQRSLAQGQKFNGKPVPSGGIVAASSVLNTGFRFSYFQVLHVGATSWYLIGAQQSNPYQL
jgi:hypothetical protein